MKNVLLILFSVLCLYMIWTTIDTSMQSNLFEELPSLVRIPWMKATLIDFYINIVVIFAWIAYKERSWFSRGLWLVLLVGLGSIAATAYVVWQLTRLKPGEGLDRLFLRT